MIVSINEFVKRQVRGSGKTYAKSLTFDQIAEHAEKQMLNNIFKIGYREGVRIVSVDESLVSDFVCPFVKLRKDTKLVSKLVKRRDGEDFYIQTRAIDEEPEKTGKVELILYHHNVLVENNENSSNSKWELISINAIPAGIDKLPMGPVTMMRNQLNLEGGTKALYRSEDWAESISFWQRYASIEPKNNIS